MRLPKRVAVLSFLLVTGLAADTLHLKSGAKVEGTFLGADSRQVRFIPENGQVKSYAIRQISSIRFGEAASGPAQAGAGDVLVPAATAITVRLIDPIDSDVNDAGEEFHASLAEDLVVDGKTIAARGSDATVKVVRVAQSGTFRGREEVSLALSKVTINGESCPVTTGYAEVAGESRGKETAKVVGGTAAVGAIIGAIAGGGKGAAIGATAGAGTGAAIQAVRGERVKIPAETRLSFALTEPLKNGD